jgi:hypothetical protein
MTREDQISAGVQLLLRLVRHDTAESKTELNDALDVIDYLSFTQNEDLGLSKQTRGSLKSYLAVLKRGRAAAAKACRDRRARITCGQDEAWFTDRIAQVEQALEAPARPQHATSHRERAAVHIAFHILRKYELPAIAKRKSTWCRLAAILAGNRDRDLYYYVCEFHRRPGILIG